MKVLRTFLLGLLLGAVVVAGCGGGDDDGDLAVDQEDRREDGRNDDEAAFFTSARCVDAANAMARASASVGQAVTGRVGELEQSVEALPAAAAAAPSEIRDDFRTIADGYARIVEVFAASDWDPNSGQPPPQEAMEAFEEMSEEFAGEGFQAASQRVSDWFANECGR